MACGNCGTGTSGKPSGCQSNGGCSTGGCNRMNVHDWLGGLPLSDSSKPFPIMEVSFNKGSRKEFYRNSTHHLFVKGDWISVEGTSGFDVGQVSLQGELVKLQMKKYGVTDTPAIKRVLRPATEDDINQYNVQKEREQEIMVRSRAMARSLKLDMKIAEVELQADGKKGTFFYTAEQRVDFRELIKHYATDFRIKVEMRQIGARQESGKVGGIGSCGRELCCSTWLTDFKSVNTAAARYQNLSINQTKLSGQCGRLKCCLNYELDTYMDALKAFPADCESIETSQGRATLQKRDIFRNLMWYSYSGSNKQYPLTVERVVEIRTLNKEGIKPEELGAVEVEKRGTTADTEVDKGFVNDVGQISLKALERNSRNRKKKGKGDKPDRGDDKKAESRANSNAADNLSRPHRPQKGQGGPQQQQRQRNPNPNQPKGEGKKPQQAAKAGDNTQQPQAGQQQQKPAHPKREGQRPNRRNRSGEKPSNPTEGGQTPQV